MTGLHRQGLTIVPDSGRILRVRPQLNITSSKQSGVLIVTLEGILDGHTRPELDEFVNNDLVNKQRHVIFDLHHVSYISSAGVSVFINVQQNKRARNGSVHLARPSASVAEVFNLLGLHALFSIHRNLDAALSAIHPPAE